MLLFTRKMPMKKGKQAVYRALTERLTPENKLFISIYRALTERLMPENKLFTNIYREGKLPNNNTNSGIHRCENVDFL